MLPGPSDYTPLYVHISRYLRGLILDGDLRMGDAIPSESRLVAMFGTTRGTVRAAINVLEADGLVRRAHGKGTFVQLQPIQHNIWNLGGFTDSLRGRTETAVAKVISVGLTPENGAEALAIADAAIVGTSLKDTRTAAGDVSGERVAELMGVVRAVRRANAARVASEAPASGGRAQS